MGKIKNIVSIKTLKCSHEEKDQIRDIKFGITQGNLGGREYNNEGGHVSTILPSISRGQQYREYNLGGARDGTAGKDRLVVLIGSNESSYEKIYFSGTHYKGFVEVM